MNYQFFDWECFNYNLWFLPEIGFLRGPDPRPLPGNRYVSVLGTAHSFARFCRRAFPERLQELTEESCLDLSTSAVGPRYFLKKPKIIEIVNAGAACIVQAPSARSCGNSKYNNDYWCNNVFQLNGAGPDSPFIHESEIFPAMFKDGRRDEAIQLLSEAKILWAREMQELLNNIRVPKILLWFSTRTPEYQPDPTSYEKYCGDFPQLVDRTMFDAAAEFADRTVEVSSRAGQPIRFTNRFTGEEGRCYFGNIYRTSHSYYPSDEMQQEAAEALVPVVRELLGPAAEPLGPSPHQAMIAAAARETASSVPDPLGLVKLIHAIRTYHWSIGVAGDIGLLGHVDRTFAHLLEAGLARSAEQMVDCEPQRPLTTLRLLVLGRSGLPSSMPSSGDLAAASCVDGAVVVLTGIFGPDRSRLAEVQDLVAHDFVPVTVVDNDLVLTRTARAGALLRWLTIAFGKRPDPQFLRREITLLGRPLAVYETRLPSDFGIDHKAS